MAAAPANTMILGVFHEFAHPEVLEQLKRDGVCEVDVSPNPTTYATTDEEKAIVRTNAKLIFRNLDINGMRYPNTPATPDDEKEVALQATLKETMAKLESLGFRKEELSSLEAPASGDHRTWDRIVLTFPE